MHTNTPTCLYFYSSSGCSPVRYLHGDIDFLFLPLLLCFLITVHIPLNISLSPPMSLRRSSHTAGGSCDRPAVTLSGALTEERVCMCVSRSVIVPRLHRPHRIYVPLRHSRSDPGDCLIINSNLELTSNADPRDNVVVTIRSGCEWSTSAQTDNSYVHNTSIVFCCEGCSL